VPDSRMTRIPNYDTDPISVICAPVSALLVTRYEPWYAIKAVDFKAGMVVLEPAGVRLHRNAAVARSRAKKRAAK